MLSGSAVLRVAALFVVAAVLAGLVQFFWPYAGGDPAPEAVPAPAPRADPPRVERRPPPPTDADPKPQPLPLPPSPIRPLPPQVAPQPTAPPAPVAAAPDPAPAAPPPSPAQIGQAAVDSAADTAGPRAVSVVDLNTGSLAELNKLKGGGLIGRSIIQHRPYTTVDQLLSKRVLSRSTYDRIKDQVTVR